MRAIKIEDKKIHFDDTGFMHIRVWSVPISSERPFGYKYSLAYIENDSCILRYDNERGKGDHKHYKNIEEPYNFRNIKRLINDFLEDIKEHRNEN